MYSVYSATSVCCSNKKFLELGSIFSWNSQWKRKKVDQQLYVNWTVLRQGYLKHFLENYRFRRKSGNDALVGGGNHYDALRTKIDMWLTLNDPKTCFKNGKKIFHNLGFRKYNLQKWNPKINKTDLNTFFLIWESRYNQNV